jgi:hypothetical protein
MIFLMNRRWTLWNGCDMSQREQQNDAQQNACTHV